MRSILKITQRVSVMTVAVVVSGMALGGCASDRPGSSLPPQKEIRGNSDRVFDKLKQEEREREKSTEAPVR